MSLVTIIIPAYNEAEVIGRVLSSIHEGLAKHPINYEIIVVDDGSTDETSAAALDAGARVVRHAYNMGNGSAVKSGIRNARGKVVVLMDGDGQHDPHDIPRLLAEIPKHGMVVGARTRDSETKFHRDFANWIYNRLASYICGRSIPDLTSGFRAIRTGLARQFLYLLPNTFSYPTTITLAILRAGHCVKYIPIKTAKRVGRSKIRLLHDGSRFLVIILKIATLFSPMKIFFPISVGVAGLGVFWYLYTYFTIGHRLPSASVILILAGILFFLIGLISEQIAQLRYDRSEIPLSLTETYGFLEDIPEEDDVAVPMKLADKEAELADQNLVYPAIKEKKK
jgi:glycosyltransferase involved in cell wall biosynthesis